MPGYVGDLVFLSLCYVVLRRVLLLAALRFWALMSGDHANVGATLLRIDRGVDTGAVFGYFRVHADPRLE